MRRWWEPESRKVVGNPLSGFKQIKFLEHTPRLEISKLFEYAVLFCIIQTAPPQYEIQTMSHILLGQFAFRLPLLFKAPSTKLAFTPSLVFGALSYSQGAARLMIPSTTISCARTWSLCPHRGQGPQDSARSYAGSPLYTAFRLRQLPFVFLSLEE